MIVDIDDFLPFVMLYVPKAPEIVALRFIREVAREICTRGPLWHHTDEFPVDEPEYEAVAVIADAEIVSIREAHFDGVPLDPISVHELEVMYGDWRSLEGSPPKYVTQLLQKSVTIVPKATGTLKLHLQIKPSLTATTLPEFLLDQYAEHIGVGAAGRLMLLPDQPFTNPQLGLEHRQRFTSECLDGIAINARRGQQKAPIRTRARFF